MIQTINKINEGKLLELEQKMKKINIKIKEIVNLTEPKIQTN
jgi:hypothetical protein